MGHFFSHVASHFIPPPPPHDDHHDHHVRALGEEAMTLEAQVSLDKRSTATRCVAARIGLVDMHAYARRAFEVFTYIPVSAADFTLYLFSLVLTMIATG